MQIGSVAFSEEVPPLLRKTAPFSASGFYFPAVAA